MSGQEPGIAVRLAGADYRLLKHGTWGTAFRGKTVHASYAKRLPDASKMA